MCAGAHRAGSRCGNLFSHRKGRRCEEGDAAMTTLRSSQAAADAAEFSALEHRFPRLAILAAAFLASQIASTILMLASQG